jgi:uncharacterized membrane protein
LKKIRFFIFVEYVQMAERCFGHNESACSTERIDSMNFYQILWFFLIYSLLGWCSEVGYAASNEGKFINRGFLSGPYCPIYGFGMLTVLFVLSPFQKQLPLLFLGSMALTTAIEFLVGYVLEKIFHEKWWDYSSQPFNIRGYICLKFSLLWGIACVLAIDVVHPWIAAFTMRIPFRGGVVILCILYALMITDLVVTLTDILRLRSHLRMLRKITEELHKLSDTMGGHISDGVLGVVTVNANVQERAQEHIEDGKRKLTESRQKVQERRAALLEKCRAEQARMPRLTHRRLRHAYPSLKKVLEWHEEDKHRK